MTILEPFFQKYNCTPEERRKLTIYFIAMRLAKLFEELGYE